MSIAVRQKDPADVLKIPISWSLLLASLGSGVTITGSTWVVPSGLTQVGSPSFTTTSTSILLSGGTDRQDYEVVNHVVLSDGQEREESVLIQVRHVEGGTSQDATDRSNALAWLLGELQPDVVPPLTVNQVEVRLDRNKAASTYAPNTFYAVGTRLFPPTRNGTWYLVVQSGTSGNLPASQWPRHENSYGARFGDGSSDPQLVIEVQSEDAIFRVDYSDPTSVNCYDVGAAARACIHLRRQMAVQMPDDGPIAFSQISERLDKILERFYPIRFPVRVVRG